MGTSTSTRYKWPLRLAFDFFLLFLWFLLRTGVSHGQTVSVFDTIYTPPGDPDGSRIGTIFVPAVGNGIGAVLAHGSGVSRLVIKGWCDTLAAHGYVAMTVEYPDAEPYPYPPRALKLAVQFLRRNASRFGITTNKIIGLGTSFGAISWGEAMIWDNDYRDFNTDSTISDHLDAAVLLYGAYHDSYSNADDRAYFHNDSLLVAKGTPYLHAANISTPILLMHGTSDGTLSYQRSVEFYDSLVAHGKSADLVLFPGQPHGFDLNFPSGTFTPPGLIAKDSALAFLQRTVAPRLRVRITSTSVNFHTLLLATRDTTMFRVEDIGDSTLRISSISNTRPEFSLLGLPALPAAIQPGGSIQFRIAFQPNATGTIGDTMVLSSDDPLHPAVKVALQGRGVPSVSPASAGVLYTTSASATGGALFRMNPLSGALDTIGALGHPDLRGMTIRLSDGLIYAVAPMPASTALYQIDAETGEAALLRRLPIAYLSALAFSKRDSLYAATSAGILYRIDLATGRTDSLGASPRLSYTCLCFRPRSDELWASVRTPPDSIFKLNTQNGAATLVGTTGFSAVTSSLAFDSSGVLYALIDNGTGEDYLATIDTLSGTGTQIAGPLAVNYLTGMAIKGGGIPVSVESGGGKQSPREFSLEQNYPNPFNPRTVVSSQLSVVSNVKLTIYDLLGREVKVLVNERRAAGYYEDTFDGSGLASGVYIYRLMAGSFVQSKPMILLK